jgi:L-seryl-tRNA(Ser) seleniumtransferase
MSRKPTRRRFIQDAAAVSAVGAGTATAGSGVPVMAASPEANVYTRLGITPVINGVGTVTVLGGSLMPPEVLRAMDEAARYFVSVPDLQVAVGNRIAELLGVPAALVTAGAASAISVATAACITRGDREALGRLPDTDGVRNEVILQSSHKSGYESQMLLVGAKRVWIETRAELERAIGKRTAMMFFLNKADTAGKLRHDEWIRVGRDRGVPTFNDAAADVPPASRLKTYIRDGFDLVAFSGGKGLLGPQSTGLLLGRPDLIEAGRHAISPAMGIGRGMKVGKEEMMGLLAAVERYLTVDHESERRMLEGRVAEMIAALAPIAGLNLRPDVPEVANPVPHLLLDWDERPGWPSAHEVVRRLREGDPPIVVGQEGPRGLRISVWMMQGTEHRIVAARLKEIFGA